MKNKTVRNAMQLCRIQHSCDKITVGESANPLSAYDFAHWASISRPTVYRTLESLVELGHAEIHFFWRGNLKCKRYRIKKYFVEICLPKELPL